jgi:dTDP-4-dehydrorhamnose 3,5-epimerase
MKDNGQEILEDALSVDEKGGLLTKDYPVLIKGDLAVDDRGAVSFVNDFKFNAVKRFYIVENHSRGFIRAWHGHKHEAKYVIVLKGSALIGTVQIDDWVNPSKEQKVFRFTLSERKPSVLFIPIGYANGFMSLTEDTKIMFLSTSDLSESLNDDFRFDSRYWDIWNIEER